MAVVPLDSVGSLSKATDPEKEKQPLFIKCILLGDTAVGKTSLVVSYTTNDYPAHHHPSALDTFYVEVDADSRRVQLQICDAGGGVEAASLRHLSYYGAHVILLCFSVVRPDSFRALRDRWVKELLDSCLVLSPRIAKVAKANLATVDGKCVPKLASAKQNSKGKAKSAEPPHTHSASERRPALLLVGCACDLRHDIGRLLELSKMGEQPVDQNTAEQLAGELGAEAYVECSALTQKNLKTVFDLAIWCGLRVATSGGPVHRIQPPSDGLSNGTCSVASVDSSSKSSHRIIGGSVQSHRNTPAPSNNDPSIGNHRPAKQVWRKFLCMP